MFCHNQNVLFIHIPKTAGQTITNYFLRLNGLSWENRDKYLVFRNGNPIHGPPQIAHLTIDEYRASNLMSDELIDNATKVAVVRNPWDRLWSEYNFNWRHAMSWTEFFRYFPDYIFDDHTTGRDALRHIMPQVDFVDDTVEILKFETLDDDFSRFCQRHSIPDLGLHNKFNVSDSGHYLKAYTPEQIDVVADFYAADIERFGYKVSK